MQLKSKIKIMRLLVRAKIGIGRYTFTSSSRFKSDQRSMLHKYYADNFVEYKITDQSILFSNKQICLVKITKYLIFSCEINKQIGFWFSLLQQSEIQEQKPSSGSQL